MKVPFEWLKEYVTIRLAPEKLAERLTMAGLEVVAIHDVGGEPVLDLEITPNRADCLSIIGMAREVAAITGQRLKSTTRQGTGDGGQGNQKKTRLTSHVPCLRIQIEDRHGCRRYIGRLHEGVKIVPSPEWMRRRLLACGARPINNVVDITNYVLFEYGQPLHAFDFDRLADGTILVRRAKPNEPITTLDGMSRTLSVETLVIADARQPVAVAGIMGGTGSEVTPATTRVLLESALFDPISVRRTARALGLASESSYRFERGVDPVGVEAASARAEALISTLAGGGPRQLCDVGEKPSKRTVIALEPERMERWLGMRVPPATIRTTLARLSCRVASSGVGGALRVSVPTFRNDLTRDVDLYEEMARIEGYDRVPSTVPSRTIAGSALEGSAEFRRLQSLRCISASAGLTEAITWALVSEADLARCGYEVSQAVRLVNPLSQDHAYLRPSLLMGLLQAVRRNLTQGAAGVQLFELGRVVQLAAREESLRLGIAISGLWLRDWQRREPGDFFRLTGLIQVVVKECCRGEARVVNAAHPWADPRQSTSVRLDGREIGTAGLVSSAVTTALDLKQDVWFAELSVPALLALTRATTTAMSAPPAFPPVKRDLSLVVSDTTPFEAVHRAIREAGAPLVSQAELIDRYVGPQVPAGQHSLTVALEYRDASRTLTAAEADALHQRISRTLVGRFGATIR